MEKICVLGAGSWGSALALVLAKKGYEVSLWTLNEEQANKINKTKENIEYLPGVLFPNNIKVTTDIEESVSNSKLIVLAVPSQAIRTISKQIKPFVKDKQILVDVAKGLEKGTYTYYIYQNEGNDKETDYDYSIYDFYKTIFMEL